MVNVKFTDNKGKTWTSSFPKKATLKDVRISAKRMNPKIVKVQYYRKKVSRKQNFGFGKFFN